MDSPFQSSELYLSSANSSSMSRKAWKGKKILVRGNVGSKCRPKGSKVVRYRFLGQVQAAERRWSFELASNYQAACQRRRGYEPREGEAVRRYL